MLLTPTQIGYRYARELLNEVLIRQPEQLTTPEGFISPNLVAQVLTDHDAEDVLAWTTWWLNEPEVAKYQNSVIRK